MGGQPGNRQDNRQRGNAAQLLEKYKSMARDSQLAGDRVQTEYYLQFADHYFRVLSENRARFEEQNPRRQRDDDMDDEDGDDELEGADESSAEERDDRQVRHDRQDRGDRNSRRSRPRRDDRDERADRDDGSDNARPRMNGSAETIPFDALPPAIGRDEPVSADASDEEPRKPRRRTRAARPADGEDEVAPAA